MDPRIEKVIEKLKTNGWTFQTSHQKPEWWFDEAFEMNSIWTPIEQGFTSHLTLTLKRLPIGERVKM